MLNTESVKGESGNLGHFHPWFRPSGKRKRNNEKPNRAKQVRGCFSCSLKRFLLIYQVPSGHIGSSMSDCCNNRVLVGKNKRQLQVRRGRKRDPARRFSLQQAEGPGRWWPRQSGSEGMLRTATKRGTQGTGNDQNSNPTPVTGRVSNS